MSGKLNGVAKAIAVLAASAMTVGLAAAPAAFADDETGNIDPATKGTLTIEKHKQTSTNGTQEGDGTQQSNVEGDLMQGVTFNLYRVQNFDMTKAENWDYLANLTASGKNVMVPTKDGGTKSVGTIEDTPFKTGVTAANGQITWSEVPLGLYYVEEGNYSGTGQITQKAEPFFVSMPYPNANKNWNYNVFVYPKNSFGTTVKHVDENSLKSAYKVGDEVAWNVDQDVPSLSTNEKLKKFGIVDRMDENVTYDSVEVQDLNSAGGKDNSVTFTADTDYTVSHEKRDNDAHDYVKIEFTEAGRTKLANVSKVRFHVVTVVSKDLTDASVPNDVFPITNDYDPFSDGEKNPPVPSEDQPYYGDYQFKKVDDTQKALSGATFIIWRKDATTEQCAVETKDIPAKAKMTATSGSDGYVNFTGLLIGKGNKGLTDDQMKNLTADFCLRETQAPAGFVTPGINETKTVNIHAGRGDNKTVGDTVTNTKQTGPKLPMTGAAGTILLTSIAAVALAVALSLYMVNARRRQQQR